MEFLAVGAVSGLAALHTKALSFFFPKLRDVVVCIFALRAVLSVFRCSAAVRSVEVPEAYFTGDPDLHLLDALDDLNLLLIGVEDDQIPPPTGL